MSREIKWFPRILQSCQRNCSNLKNSSPGSKEGKKEGIDRLGKTLRFPCCDSPLHDGNVLYQHISLGVDLQRAIHMNAEMGSDVARRLFPSGLSMAY